MKKPKERRTYPSPLRLLKAFLGFRLFGRAAHNGGGVPPAPRRGLCAVLFLEEKFFDPFTFAFQFRWLVFQLRLFLLSGVLLAGGPERGRRYLILFHDSTLGNPAFQLEGATWA